MNLIAIDTETHLLKPEAKIRSERQVPDMVCLTWSTPEENGLIEWHDPEITHKLMTAIGDRTVVFHNAKFDLAVLHKLDWNLGEELRDLVDRGRVLDTMVLYALRYPLKDKSKSLAAIVKHLFHRTLDKGAVRTSFRRGTPLSLAQRTYAIQDTVWTLTVAEHLLSMPYGALARQEQEFLVEAQPDYNGLPPDVLYSSAAAYLAWDLAPVGMQVNHDFVKKQYDKLHSEQLQLCKELFNCGLMRVKRADKVVAERCPDQTTCGTAWEIYDDDPLILRATRGSVAKGYTVMQVPGEWALNTAPVRKRFRAVADRLKLEVPTTPTGEMSLAYDFWREYEEALDDHLKLYLKLTKVRKYLSSFVGTLHHQRPERAYPNYAIPGAETGRWACFRPNMQQMPKVLRPMYGGDTVGADFRSLECFTLAQAMKSLGIVGPMMQVLSEEDMHTFVSEKIGVERQQAKVATFGLGGGMGWKGFYHYMRYTCKLQVTRDESDIVRQRWLTYFHDVQDYLQLFKHAHYKLCPPGLTARQWVEKLGFDLDDGFPSGFDLSRRLGGKITCVLPSGRVIPQRYFTQAANCFFQGIGADVMTQAFVDLCKQRVPISAVVHDAAYTPNLTAGPILCDTMRCALQQVCPDVPAPMPEWEQQSTFF
jgi:DNA polymerase III epsilon subunit-like protein